MKNINWIIHLVANGAVCDDCGTVESSFLPNLCNAHTHGMGQYRHVDFQLVLNLPPQEVARILNSFGLMVQSGHRFKNGEYISGIYEDCVVRVQSFSECGRPVLRIIIPDRNNRFPEDPSCEMPYKMQLLPTENLTYSI